MSLPAAELPELRARLLAWYERHARDLPWRRTRDPYAIWVSEVMLQQTRVETVKPYWERFLARFPTVTALAEAPLDDVLAHWSGLGYYARGRALHKAARAIVDQHGGALPDSAEALRELPGFGPYTAAAVASIAFARDEAVVDGNVARVLTRWLCREGDPRTPAAMAFFRDVAAEVLAKGSARDWNQAVMELGATVCTPRDPACLTCPVRPHCRAAAAGRQRELPPAKAKKDRPVLALSSLLVRRGGELLLARRPDEGLFASLWELPSAEAGDDPLAAARSLARRLGVKLVADEPAAEVEQALTHRALKVQVFAAETKGTYTPRVIDPYTAARFAAPAEALPGGMASATSKALAAVGITPPARARREETR